MKHSRWGRDPGRVVLGPDVRWERRRLPALEPAPKVSASENLLYLGYGGDSSVATRPAYAVNVGFSDNGEAAERLPFQVCLNYVSPSKLVSDMVELA